MHAACRLPDSSGERTSTGRLWALGLVATGILILFWSPALSVPYWQDDYSFLLSARQARIEGHSWFDGFSPESGASFWRPLGTWAYWRFVEGALGGDSRGAHLLNIGLLLLSAAAVGWFAGSVLWVRHPEGDARLAGLCAGLLYGVHAAHFLPAVWACAANDSIVVLFSALALRCWVVGLSKTGWPARWALLLVPLWFALALLSREIAIVLPGLGLLLAFWLWPRCRFRWGGWVAGAACLVVAVAWLLARRGLTTAPDPAYQLRLGMNVARNGLSLVLFSFSVPREALRFVVAKGSVAAGLWGLGCLVLQVAAFGLMLRSGLRRLDGRGRMVLPALFVVGCAPYFFLSWNCYSYYVSMGLLAYAILAALAAGRTRSMLIAVALAVLSAGVSTLGNYWLEYPALLARARWAQRQLEVVEELDNGQAGPGLPRPPYVRVENEHKFSGFGMAGLAYRLGWKPDEIVVLGADNPVPQDEAVLVVPDEGDVYLEMGR